MRYHRVVVVVAVVVVVVVVLAMVVAAAAVTRRRSMARILARGKNSTLHNWTCHGSIVATTHSRTEQFRKPRLAGLRAL